MRKLITILGILITTIILISGSAVAQPTWHFVVSIYDYEHVSNRNEILGAPDSDPASLGESGPPAILGLIVLDLGRGNEMGPNQEFTVFADSSVSEIYNVSISETAIDDGYYLGSNEDTDDHNFTTPSTPDKAWRYIIMWGWTGVSGDFEYGPDIDAVGWYG